MVVKYGDRDRLAGFYVPDLNAYLAGAVVTDVNGLAYSAINPFPVTVGSSPAIAAFKPTGEATLSVTTTSARVALGSVGPTAFVVNTGANVAYVMFGNASVVADATLGHPIPSGWGVTFDTGTATHVAAITASSTSTLTISTGTGNPSLAASGSANPAGESVNVLSVIPGTGATNLGKAEDAVHTSGDVGVMALGVATDGSTALNAAGDYGVLGTDTAGNVRVVGSVASGATNSGNPIGIGTVSLTNLGSFTDGQRAIAPSTAAGVPIVAMSGRVITGADGLANTSSIIYPLGTSAGAATSGGYTGFSVAPILFNGSTWDRIRSGGVTGMTGVNPQATPTGAASFLNIAAGQATTTVKSGAGTLYAIILNSAATATSTMIVYDNTAASGTVIGRPLATTATIPTTVDYGPVGLAFATGLTIITATANGSDMTVVYK